MEKFMEHIREAEKIIHSVDYLAYVTFPVIKDRRLIIKILNETKTAIVHCINAILQYDYIFKKTELYDSAEKNLRIFIDKIASEHNITKEETDSILELFSITEDLKKSQTEIIKDDKIVMLSGSFRARVVDFSRIKSFLITAKNILKKAKDSFMEKNKI